MTTAKVQIEIEARTAKAVAEVNKLTAATEKTRSSSEKAAKAVDAQAAATDRMGKILAAGGLVAGATAAAAAADRLSQRAIALSDVHSNLRISLEGAKAASSGLISSYALATSANTAMRFGVVKTSAEFAKHIEIATKLARTTGQDSTKAVEDLTTALSRQSPQILDNLGLQVDVTKANAEYARSIGVSVDALTDAQKRQAFIAAAYADAERKINGLTVATDGWAVSVQKAKIALLDLGDQILLLPENLDELGKEIAKDDGLVGGLAKAWSALGTALENPAEQLARARDLTDVLSDSIAQQTRLYMGLRKSAADALKAQVEGAEAAGIVLTARLQTANQLKMLEDANEEAGITFFDPAANSRRGGRGRKKSRGFDEFTALQNLGGIDRGTGDTREFAEGLAAANKAATAGQLQRVGEIEKEAMAEAEEKRLARLEEAREAAAESARKRHEEEMHRLAEQQARYERTGAAIGDTVGGLAATWLQAGDLSAQGFKKALAGWGRAESIKLAAIAISEGVQAAVSFATLNIPGGVAHLAAAGKAAAGAAAVAAMTAAAGGFGGGVSKDVGGFEGSAFGPGGSGPAANDAPNVSNSQTDTVPVSETALGQSGSANAGGGMRGGTVINNWKFEAIGSIDEQAARRIAQGMQRAGRSAGKLTG